MTTQSEFFLEHAVNGELTDAQMLQMMNLPEGDTSALLEGGMPDAAAKAEATPDDAQGKQSETKTEATTPEPDPTKAVVLAKDGVHTIPFEKLAEAREAEKHWRAQAEAAAAELAALKAAAQQRADAGDAPTATDRQVAAAEAAIDAGVDPAIFGDFSEEGIAKGIQTLMQQQAQTINAAVEKRLSQVLGPLVQQQTVSATEAHMSAIYAAHPDADSIAESKELADWIERQPSFARAGYQAVLQQGSTAQIIEFFDTFKQATGMTAQQPTNGKPDVAAAAQAALAKAKATVPTSLSEIPAGSKAHHDEAQALMEMSDSSALTSFMGKSPEQIRALLERAL
ncbi:hypothetical protein [Acidovorax sp. K2F]|uniref:hypothetical protein n=1 Tax=Acidovorax sp. K2F TaxID=2978125 RepID=UPI0021B096BD|nr:hypothetical protein [Acidovorax sp. K2F]MCT6719440.1 hypothetical protein [Acidovorax sp. K2F]